MQIVVDIVVVLIVIAVELICAVLGTVALLSYAHREIPNLRSIDVFARLGGKRHPNERPLI